MQRLYCLRVRATGYLLACLILEEVREDRYIPIEIVERCVLFLMRGLFSFSFSLFEEVWK